MAPLRGGSKSNASDFVEIFITYLVKKFDSEEHNAFISKLNNTSKVNTCVSIRLSCKDK